MFGLMIIGGEYNGMFASEDGMMTKNKDEAMKFRHSYWAKNIAYNWNKNRSENMEKWIPIHFVNYAEDGFVKM